MADFEVITEVRANNSHIMPSKKQRVEIPAAVAATVLFQSDRTCCVCRQRGKPIQIHHIDDAPRNNESDNLAVLCFDCHRDTQIRGGFDRKLDAQQIRLYKVDWIERVEGARSQRLGSTELEVIDEKQRLRYLQLREESEEYSYDFEADYVLVGSSDSKADHETNLCISAFVTGHLQRLRADAVARTPKKNEITRSPYGATVRDGLSISHSVSLFTPDVLSLEFQLVSYYAGDAHPNTDHLTLNFRLHPSMKLELYDIFEESSRYVDVLASYCLTDLHKQKLQRWDPADQSEQLRNRQDEWILRGASAENANFERFSLKKYGIVIHFAPYQVGSHAEGEYEVFIPAYELKSVVRGEMATLLNWKTV
ncbi:MAG TPA: DUF3298 domain-containing protein [Candidatus Saccharimonadales bacterium]|nr:DUF3298 domain-containing protein [Candidatus Saccharimonadales bacterium]